ncbi:MAG: hypothetical protein WB769_07240 [Pseudolabrys sp.]
MILFLSLYPATRWHAHSVSSATPMSALGQKQTCAAQKVMSALPPESGHAAKGKVAHRLCNLVHCCRAAIGAMVSEPYCRSMPDRLSDEDVSRQILGVFMRHRIPTTGTLQRNYFREVRDGDFQRGINKAVANNRITIDLRNRYRYQLTTTGYAAGRVIDPVLEA